MKTYYTVRVFWLLFIAFNASLSYEWIYRSIIVHYSPKHDTFGFVNIPFYMIGFGLAFLTLLNKTWSWWVILIGTIFFLCIGVFIYIPFILPQLRPGIIDFSEVTLYISFLSLTSYLSFQRLFKTP